MKKFFVTLIFASLASVIVGYLFSVMQWPQGKQIARMGMWMHIVSYLAYSLIVKDKDMRIVYPLLALVIVVVFNTLNFGQPSIISQVGLLLGYTGYHLIVTDYLGETEIPYHRIFSIFGLVLIWVGILFKIQHYSGADELFLGGCSITAFLLLLTGATKDLKRKK